MFFLIMFTIQIVQYFIINDTLLSIVSTEELQVKELNCKTEIAFKVLCNLCEIKNVLIYLF